MNTHKKILTAKLSSELIEIVLGERFSDGGCNPVEAHRAIDMSLIWDNTEHCQDFYELMHELLKL